MQEIVVIQHEPGEGAGTLARHLPGAQLVRVFAGDTVPRTARALVVLGGGMAAYDAHRLPFLQDELALLRSCLREGRPILGICLGSQLLALAAGGTVGRAARPELGFYRVRLAPAAAHDALFAGAPADFVAFHWHGDAFTLPPGATPLASSTLTPLQAFRHGERAWGVQFHLEVDDGVLGAMLATGDADLAEAGVDPGLLAQQARRELPRLAQVAGGVFARFAALL